MAGLVDEGVLHLVGYIYGAITDAGRWPAMLEACCRYFHAFGGQIVCDDQEAPERSFSVLYGFEHIDPLIVAEKSRRGLELRHEDPRMRHGKAYPGKPMSCRLAFSEAELHASRAYREVLQPTGIEYTLSVQVLTPSHQFGGLAFFRRPGSEAFSQGDCDVMGLLVPHLRQALNIQKDFHVIAQQRQASYRVLDHVRLGVILLTAQGRIDYVNRAAGALIDQGDGLSVRAGMLCCHHGADQAALNRAILAAAQGQAEREGLLIRRAGGDLAYHCLVGGSESGPAAVSLEQMPPRRIAVFIADPSRPMEGATELLQRLYGLTPAEARVTDILLGGGDVRACAGAGGVSEATVRSQLKAIFQKVGVNSQAQLVAAVLANPLWSCGQSAGLISGVRGPIA